MIALVAVLLVAVGVLAVLLFTRSGHGGSGPDQVAVARIHHTTTASATTEVASTVSASPSTRPASPGTAPPETAPMSTVARATTAGIVSTDDLTTPTSEQMTFPVDADKCGPEPTPSGQYRPDGQYEVTATVKLWADPSTSSTPIGRIDVDTYGPGGIGCPNGSGPFVQVLCKTNGDTVHGPFGPDAWWELVHVDGVADSYLADEWLDSKWDSGGFPLC